MHAFINNVGLYLVCMALVLSLAFVIGTPLVLVKHFRSHVIHRQIESVNPAGVSKRSALTTALLAAGFLEGLSLAITVGLIHLGFFFL